MGMTRIDESEVIITRTDIEMSAEASNQYLQVDDDEAVEVIDFVIEKLQEDINDIVLDLVCEYFDNKREQKETAEANKDEERRQNTKDGVY